MVIRNKKLLRFALVFLFLGSAWLVPQNFAQKIKLNKKSSDPALEFQSPVRITFGYKNKLYVSDSLLKMIVTVDPKDTMILDSFPVNGEPLGVAYCNRRIYVGNESKSCIQVYDTEGKWIRDIGSDIRRPNDIAIDESLEQLFVVDTLDKSVIIFALSGQVVRRIPPIPDSAKLVAPTAIALDTVNQHIFVSDYGDGTVDTRIQIFDYEGNLIGTIPGSSGGWFNPQIYFDRPQGLWIDDSGRVYVVDCYIGEIRVIDRYTNELLNSIGGHASEPDGQFRLPLDIVIDEKTKDIFVTNNRLKRIEVFRERGM